MRHFAMTLAACIFAAGPASTGLARADESKPSPSAAPKTTTGTARDGAGTAKTIDDVLALWEERSSRLNSLKIGYKRVYKSPQWGTEEYQGRACLQKADPIRKTPRRDCVHLREVRRHPGKEETTVDWMRTVDIGTEMRLYDYSPRQIFVFQASKSLREARDDLAPPNLFRNPGGFVQALLAESFVGSFHDSILIDGYFADCHAARLKEKYQLTLIREGPDAYLIGMKPVAKVETAFPSRPGIVTAGSGYIQLSKATSLPDKITLVSPAGKDTLEYRFETVEPDAAIDPRFFDPLVVKGWKVIENPAPVVRAQPKPGP